MTATKVFAVARWEYLEKVTKKVFLIGLFLTPMIMIGMGVLPSVFASAEDNETEAIGIIDQSGEIGRDFALRMQDQYLLANGQPNYIVQPLVIGAGSSLDAAVADANAKVANDQLRGYVIVKGIGLTDTTVEYRSKSVGDFRVASRIEQTLKSLIAERRAKVRNVDLALLKELTVQLDVATVKLSKAGEKEEAGFMKVFFTAYIFMMMLFMLIVTSGQLLVRSVIEEKSNRIVEVLVSSCSHSELMAGKVLGLSALGLTQIGFWTLIGVGAAAKFEIQFIELVPALLLLIYFVLGYLFYAAVFIAAGSPLTTEQEAQQVTSYLVMLLVIPIAMALPAMKSPDATWLKVLTFIPFLTPTMMALRIPIQMPSVIEIVSTIVIMVASTYFAMIAAGRIFRIAILSTGKSPKISELIRWVKNG